MYKPLNTEKLMKQCRAMRAAQLKEQMPTAPEETPLAEEILKAFIVLTEAVNTDWETTTMEAHTTGQETQDLLHLLELSDKVDAADYCEKLKEVRQHRRQVNDSIELMEPLKEWVDNNQVAIANLRGVVKAMQEAHKSQQQRLYTLKTGICGTRGTFLQQPSWFTEKRPPHVEDGIKFAVDFIPEDQLAPQYNG